MPSFNAFQNRNYQPGVYEDEFVLSNAISQINIEFSRDAWPDLGVDEVTGHQINCMRLRTWISLDGGLTWSEQAGFEAAGGPVYDRHTGEEIPDAKSYVTWNLPAPVDGVARRLRVQMEVLQVAMKTGADVTWQ